MEECDVIILAFACYTIDAYREQIETINATWGVQCAVHNVNLLYFLGEATIQGFHDTEHIKYINLPGVADDYVSASHKQFLGMRYVHDHYRAKFLMCIGTDVYVNIPKLLRYVGTLDHTDRLYVGGHGCVRRIGSVSYYFHSGGPGFILTHGSVSALYDRLVGLVEDWTAICNANGVHLISACDVSVSYYLQQPNMNVKVVRVEDLSFLGCNYRGVPCHPNQVDMRNIISCHLMSRDDSVEFTRILIENDHFM
jgi:hypothetical protein